jgi:predicted DNA-binding transcriptional regulator YafY
MHQPVRLNRPPLSSQIQQAIDAGREIRFLYRRPDGEIMYRTIVPRELALIPFRQSEGSSLCVQGHCRLRNESRTFALRRMSALEIL